MFGSVYGDIIGSHFEFASTKTKDFEFQFDSRFTDDTVLTAAVCTAILNNPGEIKSGSDMKKRALEYAGLFRQYYMRYPDAGFGGMFLQWARRGEFDVLRSYGNGAAMRVAPIGYAYDTMKQTLLQAKASCLITHNHRESIRAAQAVTAAVFLARHGSDKSEIRSYIEKVFGYNLHRTLDEIRPDYGFEVRCSASVPESIIAFLESEDYETAVRGAISLGGDADTMACIAGGIAQAYYKKIPEHIKIFCDNRIDSGIRLTIREFERKYANFE